MYFVVTRERGAAGDGTRAAWHGVARMLPILVAADWLHLSRIEWTSSAACESGSRAGLSRNRSIGGSPSPRQARFRRWIRVRGALALRPATKDDEDCPHVTGSCLGYPGAVITRTGGIRFRHRPFQNRAVAARKGELAL
jgi:hypothetical protein